MFCYIKLARRNAGPTIRPSCIHLVFHTHVFSLRFLLLCNWFVQTYNRPDSPFPIVWFYVSNTRFLVFDSTSFPTHVPRFRFDFVSNARSSFSTRLRFRHTFPVKAVIFVGMGLLPPFPKHASSFSDSFIFPPFFRWLSEESRGIKHRPLDILRILEQGATRPDWKADNGRLPAGPDCGNRGHTPNNLSRACTCRLTNKDAVNRSHQLTSTGAETSALAITGRCSQANYALLTYIYRSLRFQDTRMASTTFPIHRYILRARGLVSSPGRPSSIWLISYSQANKYASVVGDGTTHTYVLTAHKIRKRHP